MSSWSPAGPERVRLYAGPAQSPAVADSGLTPLATPSQGVANAGKLLHPDNPMLAFGVLAALTFGLMAVSTSGSVRVGKATFRAAVGAGK